MMTKLWAARLAEAAGRNVAVAYVAGAAVLPLLRRHGLRTAGAAEAEEVTSQVADWVRDHLVNHTSGTHGGLALREGPWKYCASSSLRALTPM